MTVEHRLPGAGRDLIKTNVFPAQAGTSSGTTSSRRRPGPHQEQRHPGAGRDLIRTNVIPAQAGTSSGTTSSRRRPGSHVDRQMRAYLADGVAERASSNVDLRPLAQAVIIL